ncbi:nucleotidyltransferase family protein [Streptococcus pneumoniae]
METKDILDSFLQNATMMEILGIIREQKLSDGWLCAGSVRNFIWNTLSGYSAFDEETDVDVIFFDPEISYEETLAIEKSLKERHPRFQWEVKNQVYMHIHSPHTEPYMSSQDAMSKYPEQCTAVGLRLLENDELELFAPYGLEDIVNFRLRPTPHFVANRERMALYNARIQKKNWDKKWPKVQKDLEI